jgi:rubrerythrin
MENKTELGMNRTGLVMSPGDTREMQKNTELTHPAPGDEKAMASLRGDYIKNAEPMGSVPPPATVKGALKTGMQALTGKRPQVLMDKLGERLAFERTSVRLYETLISKVASPHDGPDPTSMEKLREIQSEEARHFKLVSDCIEALGGDPTAQTPCADIAGVESIGLLQVISDPRSTITQSLHAILVAELADNVAWDELIVLAQEMGQGDIATRFQDAVKNERDHLEHIRKWHEQATLEESRVLGAVL